MRTTIEIPEELRHKLVVEAASRKLKGFSVIITEALKEYFKVHQESNKQQRIDALCGSMSSKEYKETKTVYREGRANWRA
jgi:metal-responsive CopG/Arc/MetJ family transcriptional regulator